MTGAPSRHKRSAAKERRSIINASSVRYPRSAVPQPEVTIVIPSVNGVSDLSGCLTSLSLAASTARMEVIVADRCGGALPDFVRRNFPWVRILSAPPDTPIPDLRAAAIDAATSESIAVIEDHVQVPPTWARAMLDAQARNGPVVGGVVVNAATSTVVDRAAFLCEYSHLLPPLPAGPTATLAGNNVIYDRSLLRSHRHLLGHGLWEDHLHDGLRRSGIVLFCCPDIQVAHKQHVRFFEYLSQRYLYARSYAGARVAAKSVIARFAYGAAAVGLPPVLLTRIVLRIWRRPAYRAEVWTCWPLFVPFVTAWALGEVVGAWFGSGRSLSRVR